MPDVHHGDDFLDLAYPYALDALPAADRRAVEHRLAQADPATAAAFRAAVHEVHETLADMTVVDAVPAPPSVEAALLRELDRRAPRSRVPRALLAAAAVVLVAIGVAVGIIVLRNHSHGSDGVTAQQVLTHADTRSETAAVAGGGTMRVSTSRELGTAAVAFDAVPAAPPGRVYQMWLIDAQGRPRSAGTLPALPTAATPMLVPIRDAGQVAMSVEPTGGSPTPTNPRAKAPLS